MTKNEVLIKVDSIDKQLDLACWYVHNTNHVERVYDISANFSDRVFKANFSYTDRQSGDSFLLVNDANHFNTTDKSSLDNFV